MVSETYDEEYFERGALTGKSLYTSYRWIPELTIPMAARICEFCGIERGARVLDFGCAHGFLVRALRLLGRYAWGYDTSDYAYSKRPADLDGVLFVPQYAPWGEESWDWIVSKDTLEHLKPDELIVALDRFRLHAENLFAVVPLGENGKYVVPAYELDSTHKIRESLAWWKETLERCGWQVERAEYRVEGIKDNYAQWPFGNGVFVCA